MKLIPRLGLSYGAQIKDPLYTQIKDPPESIPFPQSIGSLGSTIFLIGTARSFRFF